MPYRQIAPEKSSFDEAGSVGKSDVVNKPRHVIRKAMKWKEMLFSKLPF
jgi:hypothetical protein